jgi:protocatechuate 3,4-dioxygenase beta subunit
MPRSWIASLLFVALGFALFCASPDQTSGQSKINPLAKPTDPPGPLVSASGVIVDTAGKPIAGATVYLREWSLLRYSENPYDAHPHDILASTKTNDRGEFSFKSVATQAFRRDWSFTAPWDVFAVAPEYGLLGQHLKSADDKESLQISLTREQTIAGRVIDEQGNPVPDVKVTVGSIDALDSDLFAGYADNGLLHLSYSEIASRALTGADGRFQIAGLPADRRLTLEFEHDEFVHEYLFAAATKLAVPDVKMRDVVDGKVVFLPQPVQTGDMTVTLRPGRKVAGQVLFADSRQPAVNAKVTLWRQGRSWQTMTDAQGRFSLHSIRDAGLHSLALYLPSRELPDADAARGSNYLNRQLPIEFGPDQQRIEVEIALPRGNLVEGSVVDDETGNPIAGVTVSDIAVGEDEFNSSPGKDRLFSANTTTDKTGHFRLSVPPGQRIIHITGTVPGYDIPDPVAVRRQQRPRIEQAIKVDAGGPTAELQFRAGPGLLVDGLITDPEGKPLTGAEVKRVIRFGLSELDATAQTDAAGRFILAGFPVNSSQRLVVSHAERKLKGRFEIPAAAGETGKKRVVPVELQLQPAGRVIGQATDGNLPLVGMRVQIYEAFTEEGRRMSGPSGVDARTDADGRFTLDLVEAGREFTLSIHEDGYENVNFSSFTLKPGETFEHPAITIRRLDQTIAGIVIDPDGNPVEGATIAASDRKTRRSISLYRGQSTVTGKDGRFTMKHLPNTPLSLMAFIPSPPDAVDRTIRFPTNADADPGDTDVQLILDPKLSRGAAKKVKINGNPKKE